MTHNILIIDDDADIRETLSTILTSESYNVFSCGSSVEGNELLKHTNFSTIIVDIFLPDLNGIDFIKNRQKDKNVIPVIIITGSSELNYAREAIRLKVYDYLVKPFKNSHFLQVVRNAVLQFQLEEEKRILEQQKSFYQEELETIVQQKISQLKESEIKYSNLVEQSLIGVYLVQNDVFKYVNEKFCEIFGYSSEELINLKGIMDLAVPENQEMIREMFTHGLYDNNGSADNLTFHAITKTGDRLVLEAWAGIVQYNGESAIEGIFVDITEKHNFKEREEQLQLELLNENKLAAIGQLATGIAHNLNTPISIIQGNAELLKLKYDEAIEIDKILKQTARMSDLINTILTKGRKEQDTRDRILDINEILKDELDFLDANLYFKHHIEKEYHFEKDLPRIRGVYSDFSQSIHNILQNSIDAMRETKIRELTIITRSEKDYICIIIKDTGSGMTEDVQQKLYVPFFTTKSPLNDANQNSEIPHGTGLGLSMTYNLLKPYGVKIDYSTKLNKGTEFIIRIPLNR
ncbi:MAG: response regulator [Calditrichaceae bacterium]